MSHWLLLKRMGKDTIYLNQIHLKKPRSFEKFSVLWSFTSILTEKWNSYYEIHPLKCNLISDQLNLQEPKNSIAQNNKSYPFHLAIHKPQYSTIKSIRSIQTAQSLFRTWFGLFLWFLGYVSVMLFSLVSSWFMSSSALHVICAVFFVSCVLCRFTLFWCAEGSKPNLQLKILKPNLTYFWIIIINKTKN